MSIASGGHEACSAWRFRGMVLTPAQNHMICAGLLRLLAFPYQLFGSEQEFVRASAFIGFLSMGLFVSHGLCDWRPMFAGLFRDSWSLSGAAGIARPAPTFGMWASGTGWNAMPVSEISFHLTGNSRTGQPILLRRPTERTACRIIKLRLLRDFLPGPLPLRIFIP